MGFLTTPQTAKKLSVCENTVRNLVKRGKLRSFRDYNGRLKFRQNDVEKLKTDMEKIVVADRR